MFRFPELDLFIQCSLFIMELMPKCSSYYGCLMSMVIGDKNINTTGFQEFLDCFRAKRLGDVFRKIYDLF